MTAKMLKRTVATVTIMVIIMVIAVKMETTAITEMEIPLKTATKQKTMEILIEKEIEKKKRIIPPTILATRIIPIIPGAIQIQIPIPITKAITTKGVTVKIIKEIITPLMLKLRPKVAEAEGAEAEVVVAEEPPIPVIRQIMAQQRPIMPPTPILIPTQTITRPLPPCNLPLLPAQKVRRAILIVMVKLTYSIYLY